MKNEINSFKQKKIFKIILIADKPQNKLLILFIQLFKRKTNPMGELKKYKVRLHIYGSKQIKDIDYQNTHNLTI